MHAPYGCTGTSIMSCVLEDGGSLCVISVCRMAALVVTIKICPDISFPIVNPLTFPFIVNDKSLEAWLKFGEFDQTLFIQSLILSDIY